MTRKIKAKERKLIEARRTLGDFLKAQEVEAPQRRAADQLQFIASVLAWHDFKFPGRRFYKQYQAQCIDFIAGATFLHSYFEIGCGGGKTDILVWATIIRSYLDNEPISIHAPTLQLLRQTMVRYQKIGREFNEFLKYKNLDPMDIRFFSVSSDRMEKNDDSEEAKLEREAEDDMKRLVFETLNSGEAVAELLEDRAAAGDVIAVCNDSMVKFYNGLKESKAPCMVIIDEFSTLQTENADTANDIVKMLEFFKAHSSCVASFSATPKTNVENNRCASLAIETGIWGNCGVWHSLREDRLYAISAKKLREWGILKPFIRFFWGMDGAVSSIEAELRGHFEDKFKIEDVNTALNDIAITLALSRMMEPGQVGLSFMKAVAHIKVLMSEDARIWREEFEAKFGVKFYEFHADVPIDEKTMPDGKIIKGRNKMIEEIGASVESGSKIKHLVLNHSTWLMGLDLQPISWVLVNRDLGSINLVQAISRGTRRSNFADTCNIVLPMTPEGEQAQALVQRLFSITDTDVRHYMMHEEERAGGADGPDSDDKRPVAEVIEITLDCAKAEIREYAAQIQGFTRNQEEEQFQLDLELGISNKLC